MADVNNGELMIIIHHYDPFIMSICNIDYCVMGSKNSFDNSYPIVPIVSHYGCHYPLDNDGQE